MIEFLNEISKFTFILHLFPAIALFTFRLPRRKLFILRAAAYIAVLIGLSLVWGLLGNVISIEYISYVIIVRQIVLFVVSVLGIPFLFSVSGYTSVFCGVGAYALQNLIYRIAEIIIKSIAVWTTVNEQSLSIISFFIRLALYLIAYLLSFFLVFKKYVINESVCKRNRKILFLGIGMIALFIVFSDMRQSSDIGYIIGSIYTVANCLFILYILKYIIATENLEVDKRTLEQMLRLKGEQLAASKETIDIINIKCHDMKHQIALLRRQTNSEILDKLEQTIDIYDLSLQTGNVALDILLAEKGLVCKSKSIKFTCIADGGQLSFINEVDIYSLFGNALDNAITAVENLDEDKRTVAITVKQSVGLVSIHIENYCAHHYEYSDGLPVTTEPDKNYHGFGMKSIKSIIEKYHGFMDVSDSDNVFKLNISFPLN